MENGLDFLQINNNNWTQNVLSIKVIFLVTSISIRYIILVTIKINFLFFKKSNEALTIEVNTANP